MKSFALLMMALFLLPSVSSAADPYVAFEKGGEPGVSSRFQAWHPEYEDNGNYGESWFFTGKTDTGGVVFLLVSITNLGLRTFDGTYDLDYYGPDGSSYNIHKEYTRGDVVASKESMDVKMGGVHVWGGGNTYHARVEEPEARLTLDIENILPPFKIGDGSVRFYEDKSAEWTVGFNTPCGRSTGSLTMGGKTFDMAGYFYQDHAWADIKVPTFVKRWMTFRILEKDLAIVLHDQKMSDKFGGGHNLFGVVGVDGKIVASPRNFALTPTQWRPADSGFKVPTTFELLINAGGYKVSGTIKESRYLASIDVLGQVSWPIRMAIKAFYTNPYFHRQLGSYDISITDKAGNTRKAVGEVILETNYF